MSRSMRLSELVMLNSILDHLLGHAYECFSSLIIGSK